MDTKKFTLFRRGYYRLRIKAKRDGADWDLVADGRTPVMQLRKTASAGTADAEFTCTIENNSTVVAVLDSTQSAALDVGTTYHSQVLYQHSDPALDEYGPTLYEFRFKDSATQRTP